MIPFTKIGRHQVVIKSFTETVPQITFLIQKKLWAQVLVGLFLGLLLGMILGPGVGIC